MRYRTYRFKRTLMKLYVFVLLSILPLLLTLLRSSKVISRELLKLPDGFVFSLALSDVPLSTTIRIQRNPDEPAKKARFRRARNLTPDFTIRFISVADAFDAFSGKRSLRTSIATHALSTQGNLAQGVSLTYMFTSVLKKFFFWRSAYERV